MKIIKFYQKNCVPCNMLGDTLEALSLEVDELIEITPDNVDMVKEKYDVMSTPTLIKVNDAGEEIDRINSVGVGKISKFFKN